MPVFYNFTENGLVYSFDDVFVPADSFREGNLWTWGYGGNGRLGNATITNASTPITTFAGGTNWEQVSCGSNHTAAIKTDGTLWTWGYGDSGQLGNTTITSVSTPITTFAGGTNWKQVACGANSYTAAIKTDGTLWLWGRGGNGQLGNAAISNRLTPVTTFAGGTNWKQVCSVMISPVGAADHMAAIKTDGTLWLWGSAVNGRLGNGAITGSISTPITTFAGGNNWKQVSAAVNYTSAIKTDGTLWTWGYGTQGQLGNAVTTDRSTPVTTFAGGNNWKQVSCGGRHMAAIKTDGTLWTWGLATNGKLGTNNTSPNSLTPVTTFAGGNNWKQVSSSGYAGSSAIKTDGTLWIWGYATVISGTNTTGFKLTPVTTFAGGNNWKQVSFGYAHTAALTYDDPVI
jgi:alpha-tubulin suppressor-like RCC1 family protein